MTEVRTLRDYINRYIAEDGEEGGSRPAEETRFEARLIECACDIAHIELDALWKLNVMLYASFLAVTLLPILYVQIHSALSLLVLVPPLLFDTALLYWVPVFVEQTIRDRQLLDDAVALRRQPDLEKPLFALRETMLFFMRSPRVAWRYRTRTDEVRGLLRRVTRSDDRSDTELSATYGADEEVTQERVGHEASNILVASVRAAIPRNRRIAYDTAPRVSSFH